MLQMARQSSSFQSAVPAFTAYSLAGGKWFTWGDGKMSFKSDLLRLGWCDLVCHTVLMMTSD